MPPNTKHPTWGGNRNKPKQDFKKCTFYLLPHHLEFLEKHSQSKFIRDLIDQAIKEENGKQGIEGI